jgi:benzoyl-CoA reductase/2-hydroxyglutaryl-CoA dehydratase subunit BcrC/BadD/HgdB
MDTPMDSVTAILADEKRPVIACLPLYPPEELIHSFGAVPVVLWGLKDRIRRTPAADRHIQNYVCSIVRNTAEFLLTGNSVLPAGLFFYNACDPVRNLPEILADGWKTRGMTAPDLFSMHVPVQALGRDYGAAYLADEVGCLIARFERFFSTDFSPAKFAESVSRYAEMRRLAREAELLVARGVLSFSEFSRIMMENTYVPVEGRIARLSNLIERYEKNPPPADFDERKRVVLTGIHPPAPKVAAMIQRAGMTVVGNDIAALARSYAPGPPPTDDPADYYLRFYRDHFPCTTLIGSSDRRTDALMRLVEERRAAGLIVVGEKFCEYEYFEIPYITKRLAERGVKTLVLEFSAEDDNLGPIKTRIEAFGEML